MVGRWSESNRAYQTKSALLGGLEGLTKGGPFFVAWCLGKRREYFGHTTTARHLQVGFHVHERCLAIATPSWYCVLTEGRLVGPGGHYRRRETCPVDDRHGDHDL